MKTFLMRFPENKTKAVTLSYDDGSRYDKKFSEIINGFGLICYGLSFVEL